MSDNQENHASNENHKAENDSCYEYITTENVEDELKKLKIIDDYDSDEYEHVRIDLDFFSVFKIILLKDRICLTSSGIDIRALKAGQDIEFSVDANEKNYDIGEIDKDYLPRCLSSQF